MTESTHITEKLALIEQEMKRFESRPSPGLSFGGGLEDQFQDETGQARIRQLARYGLAALALYDAFLAVDWLMYPQRLTLAIIVRLLIVSPVAVMMIFVVRGRSSYLWREGSAGLLCLLGVGSVLFLHHNVSADVTIQAGTAFALVMLTVNALMRIDPRFAIPVSALCLGVDWIFLYTDFTLTLRQKLTSGSMVFWLTVMTLVANYVLTRERRMSYLLALHARVSSGMLVLANAELESISVTDRLTGLPNRRAYDFRLATVWGEAMAKEQPVSAVMVDVDNFKLLNDTHGHPYGDCILQRIASLLQQSMRGEDDFIARFGGEEFIVLLPNTEESTAARVAERMRTMIMVAGAPSGKAGRTAGRANRWTTISCGVNTLMPDEFTGQEMLIEGADQAMYEAKRRGRNRVCSAKTRASTSASPKGYAEAD